MFSSRNTTKQPIPRFPYQNIKNAVLGRGYDLSLVFLGDRRSRTLNRLYRGKDAPANVLSFPLSTQEGEIAINPHEARRDAKKFGLSYQQFIGKLFIHGLLHLKGLRHGDTMEKKEEQFLRRFRISK